MLDQDRSICNLNECVFVLICRSLRMCGYRTYIQHSSGNTGRGEIYSLKGNHAQRP
uniref:Uncharacterized protein n=1 Tax=Anguilla anguilla TaxID=7936 RepID=A0A0E9W5B9_ANGAN